MIRLTKKVISTKLNKALHRHKLTWHEINVRITLFGANIRSRERSGDVLTTIRTSLEKQIECRKALIAHAYTCIDNDRLA